MNRNAVKNRRSSKPGPRLAKAKSRLKSGTDFDIREAGKLLGALVDRVEHEGERLYLCRGSSRVAALVPADEGEYLEQLEDRHWNEVADKAMEEPGSIPLEQIKKELGL